MLGSVCLRVFVFPEQTEDTGEAFAFVCNLLGAMGVLVPLDHDWRRLQICMVYALYYTLLCCVRTHTHALGQCQHTDLLPSSLANYTRALKAT